MSAASIAYPSISAFKTLCFHKVAGLVAATRHYIWRGTKSYRRQGGRFFTFDRKEILVLSIWTPGLSIQHCGPLSAIVRNACGCRTACERPRSDLVE